MNIVDFLLELKELHVFISLNEEKLAVKGNRDSLNSEVKEKLKNNKVKIIELYRELNIQSNAQLAPVTFSQLRLWFIDKIQGGSVHYNVPSATRLRGDINLDAIEKAHNKIIERHESLRTVFISRGNEPYQVIQAFQYHESNVIDLTHLAPEEREAELTKLCHAESNNPFKLEKDCMMRWSIIKIADDEHVMLRTLHHIASDGWSFGVLANEFSALYQAYEQGSDNPLPDLPIQYADYAHWQRQWLKGENLDTQVKYWTEQLEGIPSVHNLPLDRVRPPVQTNSGKNYAYKIDTEISRNFNKFCIDNGVTLFMGLHAVFSLLISRYSGEKDVLIGTPIANREQVDVAPLIGFFLNTLVFRSNLNDIKDFQQLIKLSKKVALGAYAHQQVPFEQLVKLLDIEPSLSYSPIFQIMMVLHNNDVGEKEFNQAEGKSVSTGFEFAKFDLSLSIKQFNEKLWLGWNFNTDLFNLTTIQKMAESFEALMKSAIENPNMHLSKLSLLGKYEQKLLTQDWVGRPHAFDKCKYVHQIFQEQVSATPNSGAIEFDDSNLSYGELNKRANQLARYLQRTGVSAGSLVGIYMPRSLDMIISVLAVLKAGAAYVPLNSEHPKSRIKEICQDANLLLVLTVSEIDSGFFSQVTWHDISNVKVKEKISSLANDDVEGSSFPEPDKALAYVIYTSGTTGKPKGVMVSHQNAHSYYLAAKSNYNVSGDDRVLQFSSFSFDIFVEEVLMSLLSGAALILRNENIMIGGSAFWDFVKAHELTFITLPTAFWHELVPTIQDDRTIGKSLKTLVVGGEAISKSKLLAWQQSVNQNVRLLNTYGPTEATVIATSFDTRNLDESCSSVPIGKPISNASCYVLSEQLELCPIGVSGELYVGGDCVSLGYLNNKSLTKEKFIVNPFEQSGYLYKTGDIVKWSINGNLEFMGRTDNQVKIRGFRIELSEIERRLEQCSGVDSCYVAISDSSKLKKIVAYICIDKYKVDEQSKVSAKIQKELRMHLPDYMVPASFIFLESWPLTKNGKVDLKALPEESSFITESDYVAPTTKTEIQLTQIWSNLLGIEAENISASANFFDLGGHSLLIVRMAAAIREQFDQEIEIKEVFESPQLSTLSLLIESRVKQQQISEKLSKETSDNLEEIVW